MDYSEDDILFGQFQNMMNYHEWVLSQMGFNRPTVVRETESFNLYREFNQKFDQISRQAAALRHPLSFLVKTAMSFKGNNDRVEFKFHYHFDPNTQQAHMKALLTTMENEKKIYLLPNNHLLPDATQLYRILKHRQKTRFAQRMLTTVPKHQKLQL